MKNSFRAYLLTGLVVWLPILVTLWVIRFIVSLLDGTLSLLPETYRPEHWMGFYVPGYGVIISLAILLITGIIATNIVGQRLVLWGEHILARIPLVRTIYQGSKQIIQTLFTSNGEAFRQVLLVEYPRKGMWSVAFQTATPSKEMQADLEDEMVTVFIPTTPNPTSGFLMMVPKKETKALSMSPDEALKFIISLGVMQPKSEM